MKLRREHIKAHIILYSLLENLQVFEKTYQSWIELVDEDAELDGVYVHTPNPNDNNFPLKLENIKWDCPIPKHYKDLINLDEFKVGYFTGESNNLFIIQSKNNGIRL